MPKSGGRKAPRFASVGTTKTPCFSGVLCSFGGCGAVDPPSMAARSSAMRERKGSLSRPEPQLSFFSFQSTSR